MSNQTNFYIIYVILLSVIGTGCIKKVDDSFPEFPSEPVVNSILIADSLIRVHVSLTSRIDSADLPVVDNATVLLVEDDQYVETLKYQNDGIYVSSNKASAGSRYELEVTVPDHDMVTASTTIPHLSPILKIDFDPAAGKMFDGTPYYSVTVHFLNNPDKKEFFEIKLWELGHHQFVLDYFEPIDDPVMLNEGIYIALFSDELLSRDTCSVTVNSVYYSASRRDDGIWHYHIDPLIVELRTAGEDYYKFTKQMQFYEEGRFPYPVFGASPVFNLYSNINNGYGIFTGYATSFSDTINTQNP